MSKIKDIKALVDQVFPDKPDEYKTELIEMISPEYKISMLEDLIASMEKTESIAIPLAKKGKQFNDGPKQPRMDALSKAMTGTAESIFKKRGSLPTAKELWDALPEQRTPDGVKFEKDAPTDDERYIAWCKSGTPPKAANYGEAIITNFQRFKDRYTTIRKKIKNPQK